MTLTSTTTLPGRFDPVPIDELLHLVQKPQRYVGGERQTYAKTLSADKVKWALCFPETYEIGMSHLGLKILYHILNEQEDVVADRAYAPWVDMEAELRRRGLKLFAHESRAALDVFDVLGFSLQYELTYGNVLTMLDLAGVPLHATDRGDEHPLVIGGGPCMANPEPLADFFDAFLIGDGEEAVVTVTDVVRRHRGDRRRLLEALARIPGVYVPQFYAVDYGDDGKILGFRTLRPGIPEQVQRIWVEDLSKVPYPTNPVVPIAEIVQDRYAIEVVRGCTQGCRFCQAGYWYRPVRERPVEQVLDLARRGVAGGGFDDVSLVSLSTADHSQVEDMARGVAAAVGGDHVSISLPSLRADSFSVGLAEAAGEVKKNGFTFAPETGSERLRRVINKNITDASLLEAVGTAYRQGWSLIKLYFMIGIPSENMADVESIATLTEKVNQVGKQVGGSRRVTASVGAHVPKAFTPFQWEAFDSLENLDKKLAFLKSRIPRNRFKRLKWHDLQPSYLEAVSSLGDRRAGRIIEMAWRRGARFDGWGESFRWEIWEAAIDDSGVDPGWYVNGRELDDILPWDLLDASLTKKFLLRERRKAFEERLTNDCRWGDCHMCGIPGAPADIKLSVDLPEAPGVEGKHGLDGNPIRKAGFARRIGIAAPESDTPVTTPAPPREDGRRHRSPQPAEPQAPAILTRVHFRVGGPCRFVPHFDVVRAIQRACRTGRLPVRFSQGFTPRPRIAFGPPLPVGLAGARELFEIELEEPLADLGERLNAGLPAGIECHETLVVAPGGRSITAQVRAAEYLAELAPPGVADLEARLATFAAATTFPATRSRPNRPDRVIDLKRAVTRIDADGPRRLRFTLAVQEPGGHETRALDVLRDVAGLSREDIARAMVTRLRLLDAAGVAL